MSGKQTNSWCGYAQQNGFFTALVPPKPQSGFMLEIAHAMRGSGVARFLVTAMTTSGTYMDEAGFLTEYAYPAEETSSTMYEFRMAADRISVDVYQPLMNIRTSDKQSRRALARGVGTGWIANLPTYTCQEEGRFMVNTNNPASQPMVRDPMDLTFMKDAKETLSPSLLESFVPDSVIVDGEDLMRHGFFVVHSVASAQYRSLSVRAFERNLDVNAEFIMPGGLPLALGFSLVWLRDKPMKARASDDRALYFTTEFQDRGVHSEYEHELPADSVDRSVSLIWRYDLNELPREEIRVFVDPTVPIRWRPYFRKGIEAWNTAFELIGKPRTMKAVAPGDDEWPSDYNIADARFSTISWVFTDAVVSMGVAKVDPRSGEIMKSDITMSDGWVKSWLGDLDLELPNATHWIDMNQGYRRESFTATGTKGGSLLALRQAALEAGRNPGSDWGHGLSLLAVAAGAPLTPAQREQLVGEGLQDIVTHETGHILGLRHNFKGTMAVSYECTRNRSCTAKHGLSGSVMDYTPLNLPSQDAPDVHIFSPVLGAYDKLAIKYGYMDVRNDDKAAEDASQVPELEEVLNQAEAVGSCHDSDQSSVEDPSCRAYDLTDDPVRWFDSQIRLLADVQRTLLNASVLPGTPVTRYGEAVLKVLNLALNDALDCANWLGGVRDSYVHRRIDGGLPVGARKPVPAAQQRRALQVVLHMLRPQQIGLLPPEENFPYLVQGNNEKVFTLDLDEKVRIIRNHLMGNILSSLKLKRMNAQEQLGAVGGEGSLGCGEFLALLVEGIMSGSLASAPRADWDLQTMLVKRLGALFASTILPEAVISHVLFHLRRINDDVQASLLLVHAAGDPGSAPLHEHLLTLRKQLQAAVCPGSSSPECLSLLLQSHAALGSGSVAPLLPALLGGLLATSVS